MSSGKKRKEPSSPSVGDEPSVMKLRQKTQETFNKLGDALSAMKSSDSSQMSPLVTDVSLHLLNLKGLQRRILEDIHQSRQTLAKQQKTRDVQELKLENLKYQKALNEQVISESENPEASNLLKFCRSEMPEEAQEMEDSELLEKFFQADTKDPAQRSVILDKIEQTVKARQKLEEELRRYQKHASKIKKKLAENHKLLESLPRKLGDVERASRPLQLFCQHAEPARESERTIGSRLDLAKSLPKPLYTLHHLLQHGLETLRSSKELSQLLDKDVTAVLNFSENPAQVTFLIAMDNGSKKDTKGTGNSVKLSFEYDEGSRAIYVSTSNKEIDIGKILGSDSVDENQNNETQNLAISEESSTCKGLAYSWCNHLVGLHLPRQQDSSTAATRKLTAVAVMRGLFEKLSEHIH